MPCFVSRPVDAGHLVVVDVADGSRVLARFVDEVEPRDVTHWLADLVLLGLGLRHEVETGQTAPPAEVVEVATLSFDGPTAAARVMYVHHPSGTAESVDIADALDVAATGIAAQITAGVAFAEASDTDPDDLIL